MKSYTVSSVLVIVITMLLSCNQTKVPSEVGKSFKSKFPDARSVSWDKENDHEFEAEFKRSGNEMTACFNDKGEWIETEIELSQKDLPEAVQNTISSEFTGFKIEEVVRIETPEYSEAFEVGLEKDEASQEVIILKDGTILSRESKHEEGEKKEWREGKGPCNSDKGANKIFSGDFTPENKTFITEGENTYFILKPNYQLVLEGEDEGDKIQLIITVLNETRQVGDVLTRVVEERESENSNLTEVSRNFMAMCQVTSDIYYFGEEVDIYKDGQIVEHEGAWLAYDGENKPGIIMPGSILLGARYYQEIAPEKAMDRAENVSVSETMTTPAGTFTSCLKTRESTALNPKESEFKTYAPHVGLIQDEELLLVSYGYTK